MEGPSQAKIECDDKGDGSCDVRYWPTEAGEYAVHVLCNNEDIQHSPFMAEIVNPPGKDFYPDKVCSHAGTRAAKRSDGSGFKVFSLVVPGEGVWSRPAEQWSRCWEAHGVHG